MFLFHRDANDLYQVEKITLEVVVLTSFISNLALPPYYVFLLHNLPITLLVPSLIEFNIFDMRSFHIYMRVMLFPS